MTVLDENKNAIQRLCKNHQVKSLYVFGSVLTDNFRKDSDIDFIVDFQPLDINDFADNYFDFKFSLQNILNRPIDLLEEKALKNPYFKEAVNPKRQLVYRN